MVPYHSANAPSLDRGILARARRVHPGLRLTYSPFSLDMLSGHPILFKETGRPVDDPAWYLWLKDGVGSHHIFVNLFPMAEGGFGNRNCEALESDIGRRMRASQIGEWLRSREESVRARRYKAHRALQMDKVDANKNIIKDTLWANRFNRRPAKIVSYAGQKNRGSRGEVHIDPREAGWELPDPD